MTASNQVRTIIDRILRLKEEQDQLGEDIREIYAEAKGNGFDKTALGQVVALLRKREKQGAAKVEEQSAIIETYLAAYAGTPVATHAHEGGPLAQTIKDTWALQVGGTP